MRDLTLSQEYLLCAVNEKGRLPHLGVERTVCLVAAALLELQLEGCVAVDKKYVTVTGPLPEGQACRHHRSIRMPTGRAETERI